MAVLTWRATVCPCSGVMSTVAEGNEDEDETSAMQTPVEKCLVFVSLYALVIVEEAEGGDAACDTSHQQFQQLAKQPHGHSRGPFPLFPLRSRTPSAKS